MDLSTYLASLRDDLTTTASAGDEATRRAAAVLAAALEPSARLAIMNALADLAAEITATLPDHVVEVRLDGRDVKVVVTATREHPEPPPPPPPPPPGEEPPPLGGDMSRMTLRLFEELKAKAERAASSQGVSLNTFVQQAVQGALSGHGKTRKHHRPEPEWDQSSAHRVQGWYEG
ncbi:toxin-antitoxin system HicB family antitoxin [Actinokineospora enzanensis]|uniref:toxin-antitoxin system HicB family antitoxin n=1 Tax=Actinokineospora enzanensis TaxID=155975 RepID=UPI000370D304|nr:toxin-antitoxin system HicB family antitoxin [Actinokineospora enzanensis]